MIMIKVWAIATSLSVIFTTVFGVISIDSSKKIWGTLSVIGAISCIIELCLPIMAGIFIL